MFLIFRCISNDIPRPPYACARLDKKSIKETTKSTKTYKIYVILSQGLKSMQRKLSKVNISGILA